MIAVILFYKGDCFMNFAKLKKDMLIKLFNGFTDIRWAYSANNRKKYTRRSAVKNAEQQVLTEEQKIAAKEFYKPFYNITTAFHNFYTEKTGEFHANYIPGDVHSCYIDPFFSNWAEAEYIDNKCMYPNLFQKVKHAKNIFWRSNNLWFDGGSVPLTKEQVNAKLSEYDAVFLKVATSSCGGSGVFFITGENKETTFWKHIGSISEDVVVQEPIVQHEQLNRLNSSSVNTIRAISLLSESGVKIYSSILRMGINGAKVDNASSGGISCGIDNDGKLKKHAFTSQGKRFNEHPDSKIAFEGFEIPGYNKIQQIIPELHCQAPHFRLISWDFAIQEDGEPILIEANLCNGELVFHQLNNGPLFGEDTYKILSEVFSKDNR